MAYRRDVLELTNGELCILRWLRISNGKATLSASAVAGKNLFIVPDRLLKAGYVRTRIDQLAPKTVHYILTESGLEALESNESVAFFSDLAKRRRPRSGVRLDRRRSHEAPTKGRADYQSQDR
jgi:DNA-binding MarR family transcriptional regulator